jgi:DNA replicative helicase MCM subunit Mcm2 (Cdc46/Mcm family)
MVFLLLKNLKFLIERHNLLYEKYRAKKIQALQNRSKNMSSLLAANNSTMMSNSTHINFDASPLLESTSMEQQQPVEDEVEEEGEIDYARELSAIDDSDIPIKARIYNYPNITKIKQLKSHMYNTFVSISGTVVRVGNTQPYSVRMAFKCPKCNKHFVIRIRIRIGIFFICPLNYV